MVYSFELIKHANIRYRDSLSVLAQCELFSMLLHLGISCDLNLEELGGSRFLTFECRELSEEELSFLSGHSAVVFWRKRPAITSDRSLSRIRHTFRMTFRKY